LVNDGSYAGVGFASVRDSARTSLSYDAAFAAVIGWDRGSDRAAPTQGLHRRWWGHLRFEIVAFLDSQHAQGARWGLVSLSPSDEYRWTFDVALGEGRHFIGPALYDLTDDDVSALVDAWPTARTATRQGRSGGAYAGAL